MSNPTPKYLKHDNVYPPSEDTFVMLDALEKDIPNQVMLWKRQADETACCKSKSLLVCEVGVGSGISSIFLDLLLRKEGEKVGFKIMPLFLGIDVNPDAISNTKINITLNVDKDTNGAPIPSNSSTIHNHLLTSLFNGIHKKKQVFDIVLFNPPYVVTTDTQASTAQSSQNIQSALDGGHNGRRIIDLFLQSVHQVVSKGGIVYLVLVNENGPDQVEEEMKERGWRVERVLYRVCGWEGLHVLKFIKV